MQSRRSLFTSGGATRDLDNSIGAYRSSLLATRLLTIIGVVSMLTLLGVSFLGLHWWAVLAGGLASGVLITLVEAPMRSIGSRKPERFIEACAVPLTFLSVVMRPLTRFIPFNPETPYIREEPTGSQEEESGPLLGAEEFKQLVTDLGETPELREEEKEMIGSILALKDTVVKGIMVPRPDFTAIRTDAGFEDLVQLLAQSGRSRVPLYDGTMDNIVGVIYAQDVLKDLNSGSPRDGIRELARKPFFVPESKNVYELLDEFRDTGVHFALVVDEYGGVEGLVTINDVLEEIVGELAGEFELHVPPIRMVAENEAIVEGNASLEEFNDALGTELEAEYVSTMGGYVLYHIGHIPKAGESVRIDGIQAHVVSTVGRRIKRLRIKIVAREQ